jgi:hypothetical protein
MSLPARVDYYAAILAGTDPAVALAALRAALIAMPPVARCAVMARAHRIARSGLGVVA